MVEVGVVVEGGVEVVVEDGVEVEVEVVVVVEGVLMENGKTILVFTATHAIVGTVVESTPFDLTLKPAAWVADTGRLHEALRDGFGSVHQSEIEPLSGAAYIPRTAIMYATDYEHAVPTEMK